MHDVFYHDPAISSSQNLQSAESVVCLCTVPKFTSVAFSCKLCRFYTMDDSDTRCLYQ